ncbi:hypothetical protein [Gluconacetobacter entanii]|uniref:hypothetical protein n=1 Tax=Gluconacetobacter entanii TaxID=108528 RepID=UPI0021BBD289|nr:hypothetical protein [Gluconacetobacter entanii]MCW4581226.1 hypothetical protein [Gluconacetobacter entanii]MCW4584486.1 hypothetical protein [Gluconacetobacter entanii]
MKPSPMLTRGDVVVRGNRHGIVVTVTETRVLVVPIVWGTARLHRADVVPIAWEATFSLRGAIIHCGQWTWVDASQQKRVGQVCVQTMQTVMAAMRREVEARQTERLPAGLVRSTLAFGPMMGSRGRRVGAPSLG